MKYVFKMIIVFLALGMSSMSGCKKAASFENENITIEHGWVLVVGLAELVRCYFVCNY